MLELDPHRDAKFTMPKSGEMASDARLIVDMGGVALGFCANNGLLVPVHPDHPYLGILYDLTQHPNGLPEIVSQRQQGSMGIFNGMVLGRSAPSFERAFGEHLSYKHVSSNHATIRFEGATVVLRDLGSTNGTRVGIVTEPSDGANDKFLKSIGDEIGRRFRYTLLAEEAERLHGLQEALDRPLIKRDSKIDGGCYWSNTGDTATVVDWEKQKDYGLGKVESDLLRLLAGIDVEDTAQVAETVRSLVEGAMPYRGNFVEHMERGLKKEYGNNDSLPVKVALVNYLKGSDKGSGGVCRHQCLLAGLLLERMIGRGELKGKVSVDRNVVSDAGHAWTRYTDELGRVFIIDPAQKRSGQLVRLGEGRFAIKSGNSSTPCSRDGSDLFNGSPNQPCWPYCRPEDLSMPITK